MQEELIKFETAKLAKDKGFDFICDNFYWKDNYFKRAFDYETTFWNNQMLTKELKIQAPTQSLLAKWLRETHETICFVDPFIIKDIDEKTGRYKVRYESVISSQDYDKEDDPEFLPENCFDTYEEALEDALITGLNYIKN